MERKTKKRLTALLNVVLCILLSIPTAGTKVKAETVEYEFSISGYDTKTVQNGIILYPNKTDNERIIAADTYNFRYSKLMIFNSSGRLIEAGGDLLANADGTNGSPQNSVKIPVGGFMIAFGAQCPTNLMQCYNFAFENAMLYNATMTVIRQVYGEYSTDTDTLVIKYDSNQNAAADAKKFLFVGNSTTYFNGTPLKFKAMCKAAEIDVITDYCTFGSAVLREFADENHDRGKAFRVAIKNKYDYVVLQDSGGASYETGKSALDVLIPLIRESGAEPLLYMRYSSTSNVEGRKGDAQRLYGIYAKFARDYGVRYAPVAPAFVNCAKDHPEIRLYGDDNSHHSAEGSYLIAATWLYAYLGVSPVGNAFTAYLPEKTAADIQAEAVKSVDTDNGSFYETERAVFQFDGKKYINLAQECEYTPTGAPYEQSWSDTGYDGKPLGKLTNGVMASSGTSTECGCYLGKSTSVTIDLQSVCAVRHFVTDLYGNEGWGIPNPDSAEVTISLAERPNEYGKPITMKKTTTPSGAWVNGMFTLTLDEETNARYVRINYNITGNFCWSSEIQVFGIKAINDNSEEESSKMSEKSAEPTSANASSVSSADESNGDNGSGGIDAKTAAIIVAAAIAAIAVGIIVSRKKRKNS